MGPDERLHLVPLANAAGDGGEDDSEEQGGSDGERAVGGLGGLDDDGFGS